jgi:hypothetical protein
MVKAVDMFIQKGTSQRARIKYHVTRIRLEAPISGAHCEVMSQIETVYDVYRPERNS